MGRPSVIAALLALGILASAVGSNAEPAQAPPGFELARLEVLRGNLTPTECARIYLSFLQDEIATPTPKHDGLGGPITHEYVLAQMVLAAAQARRAPDRDILMHASIEAKPGTFRDCIGLTLGLLGDRSVVPFLVAYLADAKHSPHLRERAARALGQWPDVRAIPVLVAALNDPYHVVTRRTRVYDIRITARASLGRLEAVGVGLPAEAQRALDNVVTTEKIPRQTPKP